MKKLIMILAALSLVGCATAKRVPTFEEAVKDNPNLESGIYNRTNGENVAVTVTSMKARIAELEKQALDAQKEAEYYKKTNEELKYENIGLRARGNYQMTEQKPVIKGFDEKSNPIVEQTVVNREPAKVESK
jgi:uncharacterized protein YcfL